MANPDSVSEGAVSLPGRAAAIRQFVVFHIGDEAFAIPMAEVKEIVRMPDVARVPLCPPSFEGLVNLRGTVQPVLATRRLFGLPDRPTDSATRVIIVHCDESIGPVGLVVDRMSRVVSVEADRIEAAEQVMTTLSSDLLDGVIKGIEGHAMVMILATRRLIESDMPRAGKQRSAARRAAVAQAAAVAQTVVSTVDALQMVCFEVDGQEYGIEIRSVQEIVEHPAVLAEVPRADAAVSGMMTLRDQLLPVVSLRHLFGLAPAPVEGHTRIAVLSLPGSGLSVGIVLDRVREVLRVSREVIDPMPSLLAKDDRLSDVTAVCRLDGGRRVISLLDPEAMFAPTRSPQGLALAETMDPSDMTDTPATAASGPEEQFVVFRLMDQDYGAPLSCVQEIVRVPAAIAKVPKSPDFIDGVINLRGAVIPVVDQRRRFGLPAAEAHDGQRIVVLTLKGMQAGFIVDGVTEVMRAPRAAIEPAPDLSEEQSRIISRVVNLPAKGRMVLILEPDELLDGMERAALAGQAA